MPKAPWSFEPVTIVSTSLDARSQEASSFALFAAWAVDDLYYLADIDLLISPAAGVRPDLTPTSSTSRTPDGRQGVR